MQESDRRRGGNLGIGPGAWGRSGLRILVPLLGCLRLLGLVCIPLLGALCRLRGRLVGIGPIFLARLVRLEGRVRRASLESRLLAYWRLRRRRQLRTRLRSLGPLYVVMRGGENSLLSASIGSHLRANFLFFLLADENRWKTDKAGLGS